MLGSRLSPCPGSVLPQPHLPCVCKLDVCPRALDVDADLHESRGCPACAGAWEAPDPGLKGCLGTQQVWPVGTGTAGDGNLWARWLSSHWSAGSEWTGFGHCFFSWWEGPEVCTELLPVAL